MGLCGTDLDLFDGSMPYLHQGFASAIRCNPAMSGRACCWNRPARWPPAPGVILDPMIDCGREGCPHCGAGLVVRCPDRRELGVRNGLDGAMATVVEVPQGYLLPIPEAVATRDAALVEPMVTTLEGIRRTDPQPGEEVLIVGAATLGLVGAMILGARGLRTHVLLRSPDRAAHRRGRGRHPLAGRQQGSRGTLRRRHRGSRDAAAVCRRHCATWRRVVASHCWACPPPWWRSTLRAIAVNDVTILGVLNGPGQFGAGLAAIASGAVMPELLIDSVFPFDEVGAALERSRERGRARPKVLVAVGEDPG